MQCKRFIYFKQLEIPTNLSRSKRNIRIIHIDLSIPIERQGNLDLIVHKMTDLVAKIERGDTEAKKFYQRFIVSDIEHSLYFNGI